MEIVLNYRHAFHAGNFADLVKHAILLALLARLTQDKAPLEVIDTHAGAGQYDLQADAPKRSGEAEAGIGRLMGETRAPAVFELLKAAVRVANPGGGLRVYPGSPDLILGALRAGDSYTGCELRPDECADLRRLVSKAGPAKAIRAEALQTDGYGVAAQAPAKPERRALILIDPPFERGDEYRRLAETLAAALRVRRRAVYAIWTPLKDLETFDGFLRELQGLSLPPTLVAQARLRPLHDPMKMNGCAMIVLGLTAAEAEARDACDWVARRLGEAGGEARVGRLST